MTAEQFKRVEALFFELRPMAAQQRGVALDSRCPDDPDVRAEVEKMLGQDGGAGEELSRLGRDFGAEPSIEVTRQFIGQRVGCYEVLDVVGQGGMGVIYRARDVRLSRPAALKAILPVPSTKPYAHANRLERLRREARVLASISHPNIATIYGLEESHDTLFIAMEFIDGKTLSQRLGRGNLLLPDALAVCEQIAAGVEAAHEAGVIHRDLKPGNVMFTADGTAKVLDFGLARELKADEQALTNPADRKTRPVALTRHGSFFGTPAYMSPEQARGEPLDRRSDIFSFGSIMFRCLTGRPAFDGEGDLDTVDAILHREPDWSRLPENSPAALVKLLRRCLAKDPADRYRHIGDVRLELRELIDTRAWEQAENSAALPRKRKGLAPGSIAALAACIALLAAVWPRWGTSPGRTNAPAGVAQRLDTALPEDVIQKDLERLQVALSPDGRFIVAPFQTSTGQELWIRPLADGSWRRVEGTLGAHRPFVSPDGQWVGFQRDGYLYKRRLSGGDPIRMINTTNWYGASWMDGDVIAYAPTWGDPIHTIARPGAPPVPVSHLNPDKQEFSHISPMVTPGGKWVLYHVWHGGEECSIHATEMATGSERVVMRNATSARVAQTPGGLHLLFERASTIFAAPFDVQTATVTGAEQAVVDGVMNDGTRFAAYFDVADDGTLIYIPGRSFAEESRMSYVTADGKAEPFNDDRMSFSEPKFSHDGKKLAVGLKGKVYEGLIYDFDRQTRERLLTGGDTVAYAFSSDGKQLACTINRDIGYGIHLIDLIGEGTPRRITMPGPDYQSDLDWSRDGKSITFTMSPAEGAPRDIWRVEVDAPGHPIKPVIATSGADIQGAISPDDKWIAYASDATGRQEVYLAAFPAGDRIRPVSTGGGEQPVWSPDGKSLYYIAPHGLVSVAVSEGVPTGRPTVVYDKPFGQSDPIARDYTIAPDGRPFIIEPSERRPGVSHLCVVTNWYQLLK